MIHDGVVGFFFLLVLFLPPQFSSNTRATLHFEYCFFSSSCAVFAKKDPGRRASQQPIHRNTSLAQLLRRGTQEGLRQITSIAEVLEPRLPRSRSNPVKPTKPRDFSWDQTMPRPTDAICPHSAPRGAANTYRRSARFEARTWR
jgi:hypothetical protein